MDDEEYSIGLDLGTTFSCIGVYKNGKVEIIENKRGEKITPSVVIINHDSSILVGEDTTEFLVENYDSCIYEIKRLIGRKFSDKEVKEEIGKLPFKITTLKGEDSPMVEVNIEGIPISYSPVEISAFIIKKMVQTAEKYLNKKVKKLVITVPAYFSDSQRKLTKQAAELVGLKVLRVINEPTAAAIAYGFDKKQESDQKILVFDLGGGTFDVSILNIKKDETNPNSKVFQVLGTSGDMNLGGEDFDNQLVDYFLNKKLILKEEMKKDMQFIKDLKLKCEVIKKTLSNSKKATLKIDKFNKKEDLIEEITREEFEAICHNLFKKLETPLEIALANAKLTRNDINEVILVGGSTRIPKVKQIVRNYFPKSKINDSINPDEAVAFGATIEAEKINHNKNSSISNFLLLDITPLSLGTNVLNKSENKEIKEEGAIMSVIIPRGSPIPSTFTEVYSTAYDNQESMAINIYEGENNFVKYNNLLKKESIKGLKKGKKGETKVRVTLDIDIHGILNVSAKEESDDGQSLNYTIINDEMSLSQEKLKKLKEKNEALLAKIQNNDFSSDLNDYNNLKDTLRKYKEAFEQTKTKSQNTTKDNIGEEGEDDEDEDEEENDELIVYKTNYNNTLEEFINSFNIDKGNVNEALFEKYYLYVKELFISYAETLKLKIDSDERKEIIEKIKNYLNKFISKSSDYINNLLEVLYKGLNDDNEVINKKKKPKKKKKSKNIIKNFCGIVIFLMEKLNDLGKKYIESMAKFCKYNSLIMFEQANYYYEKYLSDINVNLLGYKEQQELLKQKEICQGYIKDINSGAIVLCLESFKGGYLIGGEIKSSGRGITNDLRRFNLANLQKEIDTLKLVLSNYEKILSSIQSTDEEKKNTQKEAICIANIIKINEILGELNSKKRILFLLAERCKFIIERQSKEEKEKLSKKEWYLEFNKLYESLQKKQPKDEEFYLIIPEMRRKYEKIFNEIEEKFNKKKSNIDFISFILKNHPYRGYENDINNKDFYHFNLDLINFLLIKYQPENYKLNGDEKEKLEYCIVHVISQKLSNLYRKIN